MELTGPTRWLPSLIRHSPSCLLHGIVRELGCTCNDGVSGTAAAVSLDECSRYKQQWEHSEAAVGAGIRQHRYLRQLLKLVGAVLGPGNFWP